MNKRPIGISILAVLHVIGGVVLVGLLLLLVAKFENLSPLAADLGVSAPMFVASIVLLTLLTFAAGIGMWRGARWGWWTGAFYYLYSIVRHAGAIWLVYRLRDTLAGLPGGSETAHKQMIKFAGRIIVSALIFAYFFKPSVLAYFRLEQFGRAKAIGILAAVTLAVYALLNAINGLTQ
ncbi:MAG TPA: hypothetical protein VMF30_19310 [Pirellulales bacterium]|nr:hypothetical protein [Pirellulales bacterium]